MEAGAEARMEAETETDFEQSIDEINTKKLECNGLQARKRRSGNNPDYRDNSDSGSERSERNGYLVPSTTKKKKSKAKSGGSIAPNHQPVPLVERKRAGGKPFSHQMRKSSSSEAAMPRLVVRSGGKPRSMMLGMSSGSKKKQGKSYYHSQITEEKNAIKIRIRKASTEIKKPKRRKSRAVTSSDPEDVVEQQQSSSSGSHHKKRHRNQNAQEGVTVPAILLPTVVVTPTPIKPKETKKKSAQSKGSRVVEEQGPWGASMPQEVLITIFSHVVAHEGVLPSLVKLGEVCRTWHSASVTPQLWNSVELSQHTKDKMKTDHRLVWLLENRLRMCQQLNLGNWKVSNLGWIVETITSCCPLLEEINLTGWKGLSVEQLRDITHDLTKLARLDLSCTSEASSSGGCLSVVSLTQMSRGMGERLTHLTLANNKLAGLPSILNSLAEHCPNLELLDLSNLWVVSHPAMVPLERLQKGCPKLKVLRITNSQVVLATASTQDQMESPGFPLLEELSVACPSVDYKLVDDEALGRILKGSTCLRLLDVRGCIRITDSGLIKVPAWDLQHLFLSGCAVTRQCRSCLELICEKWSHSLVEVDLAWATATQPLDAAVDALADRGAQSKLRILNLCGSSVSLEPVKRILVKCPNLESVNLASCRALPRGMKRNYTGKELQDLRDSFDPVKKKEKEEKEKLAKEMKKKAQEEARKLKEEAKHKEEGKADSPAVVEASPSVNNNSDSSGASNSEVTPSTGPDYSPRVGASNMCDSGSSSSPTNKQETLSSSHPSPDTGYSPATPKTRQDTPKSTGSWNMGSYSPSVTRQESPYPSHSPSAHHQESPYSSQNSPSIMRQESPSVVRLESPYSSQKSPSVASPYSSQIRSPSVARQESPYSSVKSPYSSVKSPSMARQESPYSSHVSPSVVRQESPYSSHVSPSVVRQESPYSTHVVSPSVVRQESPYSSHMSPSVARQESPYSSHVSPSVVRQESPYSSHVSPSVVRQESPYSSHVSPSVVRQESPYSSQKSPDPLPPTKPNQTGGWNLDQYSPIMRQESASSSQPSPEAVQGVTRPWNLERFSPMPSSAMMPSPDTSQVTSTGKQWNLDRFSPMTRAESSPAAVPSPEMSNIKPTQSWNVVGHPSPETGQSVLKSGWNLVNHFPPVVRPPPGGPLTAHMDAHNKSANWNLNQFNPKVDSCVGVPGAGQRTGLSDGVYAVSVGDQVTTTTYCANPDQNMYRNFRDPINAPSSVD